jgi:nicotinamide-nucleotide amidase
VRSISKTDYSLSTTGNLGPDVLEGKDRGLVFVAVSSGARTLSRGIKLDGDREANKEEASLFAIRFLAGFAGQK